MTAPDVLLTGATGFVGNRVLRLLLQRGERVRVLVRPQSNLTLLEGLPVEQSIGDLKDLATLREAVRGCRCVYHVAADYRLSYRDAKELYRNNVEGTKNLVQASIEASVERFVYTSTVGTIGQGHDGELADETTASLETQFSTPYKHSKYLAEQAVLNGVGQGLPAVIVNPTTPIGAGDVKPTPTGRIIVDFLNGKLPAYVDTGLNWVHVRDVAEGHLRAAASGRVGERYILGNRNMSLLEFLTLVASVAGRHPPRIRLPYWVARGAAEVENWLSRNVGRRTPFIPLDGVKMACRPVYVKCDKAVRELDLPQTPIRDAVGEAISWFTEKGYVHA